MILIIFGNITPNLQMLKTLLDQSKWTSVVSTIFLPGQALFFLPRTALKNTYVA